MLKSNRSEQSRYYGDFRGVDFSTDHTLVSERRFPYLVNMYKDYAAGAGQGIETIPGFRRRFVAPNGGKVHGIHSYKDKSGKRRVYVHAGNSLYDWKNYPSEAGFMKEVRAVVREYDEYSSSVEGVGIATDYVKAGVELIYSYYNDTRIDVRAMRKVGSQKWISIYPEAMFYADPVNALYIPDAYAFTQSSTTEKPRAVEIKFPKLIKDSSGTVIEQFTAGDTVEFKCYALNGYEDANSYNGASLSSNASLNLYEQGVTESGERIVECRVQFNVGSSYRDLPVWYGTYKQKLTGLSVEALPKELTVIPRGLEEATRIAPVILVGEGPYGRYEREYEPFVSSSKEYSVYMLYDGDEAVEDIDLTSCRFYQYDTDGNRVYLPSDISHGFDRKTVKYTNVSEAETLTVLEFDEYADLGQSDYVSVDASGGRGLALLTVRRGDNGGYISSEDYRLEGREILFKKSIAQIGDEMILTFGSAGTEEDVLAIYGDMNERESQSFVFGERLYIIDGKNYLYVDDTGVHRVADSAYVPTTYINIVVGGENADAGAELEPRNMLSPYFKNTFIPDGETTEYYLNEKDLEGIKEITVWGSRFDEGEDYEVDLAEGKITFKAAPDKYQIEIPDSEQIDGTAGIAYRKKDGSAYYECTGMGEATGDEITIGNCVGEKKVVSVADNAFFGRFETPAKVIVSEGISRIGARAFDNAYAVKSVELPESLTYIGDSAFAFAGIKSITIPRYVNTIFTFTFWNAKDLETVEFKGVPSVLEGDAFLGCDKLKKITVPWKQDTIKGAPWGAPADAEIVYGEETVPTKLAYPEAYAGVEITGIKGIYPAIEGDGEATGAEFRSMIESATICTVFDNRVFFSGIPSKPNFIFWSSLKNPSYIGILNYQQDGVGTTPITAMVPVAKTLLVLKGDTEDGGAAFYHTPLESGINVMAKSYPSEEGLAGIGCLGAACNFLDDPVYVSRLGLEAVGYLSLQNERSREHRSSLIDAKLVNLKGLADAKLCEWGGYLVLLVDGKIFLADSRQKFADATGAAQYEWYYLEDIGVFEGQYDREKYITEWPEMFRDENGDRLALKVAYEGKEYTVQLVSDVLVDNPPAEVAEGVPVVAAQVELYGNTYYYDAAIYSVGGTPAYAFLCDGDGEKIGGTFCPAITVKTMDDGGTENLFFGTTNGIVCSFNFDKRGADGTIPADSYTFDGRTILSGCALKMDNCGIPHMTKTTVKKSTVIKVKSFQSTAAKVRVRTNKNPYNEIARINATRFSFDNLDFSDFSFVVGEDSLFAVREKEKKWVEKQYYIYSDEYKKPFALYYAAFKYFVAGKFKK